MYLYIIYYLMYITHYILPIIYCLLNALNAHVSSHHGYGPGTKAIAMSTMVDCPDAKHDTNNDIHCTSNGICITLVLIIGRYSDFHCKRNSMCIALYGLAWQKQRFGL